MKSMQRRFGGMMKRSADEADVGAVLADFKTADDMLERLIQNLVIWRNSWEDVLKLQYNAAEAMATLYKPIEPTEDPEMRHRPAVTPERYLHKCLNLQKMYAETRGDLAQEIGMITTKLVRPAEEARQATKALHKTLKYRENKKLDYERYLGRAEHARKRDNRSMKDEAALIKHENDLTQAQIDYQTADEQVKQTFPPVTDAVIALMPYLMANQIMLQTTIVGQLYTVLDAYCRRESLPSPAPSDAEIVKTWDREFTSLRKEVEQGLKLVSQGKVVHLAMTLPKEEDPTTSTGLGIRNKMFNRNNKASQPLPEHSLKHTTIPDLANDQLAIEQGDEQAPPKPPRPGGPPSPAGYDGQSYGGAQSQLPASLAIRNHPGLSPVGNYSSRAEETRPPYPTGPSTYGLEASPSPKYQTPPGGTPTAFALAASAPDYFATTQRPRQPSSTSVSTIASSLNASSLNATAAAKKKPPPPVPAKRINSNPGPQFVLALYDFDGQNPGDLAFREGDRIRVVRKTERTDDWWEGEIGGRQGSFPANYVQV